MTNKQSPTSDADPGVVAPETTPEASPSDERVPGTRSSLDRLADFTRAILRVPKSEVERRGGKASTESIARGPGAKGP